MRKYTLYAATLALLFAACLTSSPVSAQTYTVLYDFPGVVGGNPFTGVIQDSAGNLYGTMRHGGAGWGTVYKIDTHNVATVLYKFRYGIKDGLHPWAGLVFDSVGNLYGTTYDGGQFNLGTVYKVTPSGKETILHSFAGTDGSNPGNASLILDSAGNLYGTTPGGGKAGGCGGVGCGVVFKLSPVGKMTVLHRFQGPDGRSPNAALLRDSAGNLYGTTAFGGKSSSCGLGCGEVFKLSPSGKEVILHNFTPAEGGGGVSAPLIQDSAGNFYGTTSNAVFKLDTSGNLKILHTFPFGSSYGGVVADSAGNLFGVSSNDGAFSSGLIYEIDATGRETDLYSLDGRGDGRYPWSSLLLDSAGNLYGTTYKGGAAYGALFRFHP